MADLELPAVCLVVGKELADLTVIIPGPFSGVAFLDRMLHRAEHELRESSTIKEAVNASPRDWRDSWMSKNPIVGVEDLCPIHLAISKSLEFEGENNWLSAFEKAAQIEVGKPISPLKLAMQVYQENLFIQAIKLCN